jgi:AcrR family transcriptional regulator
MDKQALVSTTGRSRRSVREKEQATTERIDRRAARTRRALHDALMTLILRKGYDAVTVQDIIDEADVGRSTFYAHYTGKEDLLRSGFQALRAELTEARHAARTRPDRPQAEPLEFSLAMFEHAARYTDVARALVGGRGSMIVERGIRQILLELVREELPAAPDGSIVSRELVAQFIVGAFHTTLSWWLERKPKLPPAEIDDMFRRLILDGIRPVICPASQAARVKFVP